MTSPESLAAILERVISGDLANLAKILGSSLEEVRKAQAARRPHSIVNRRAVLRVLQEFKTGSFAPDIVQRWASLLRHGFYGPGDSGPVYPVEFEYDQDFEDPILDVLSRLDELGDLVDGTIGAEELEKLIRSLEI